ncbi:hypothetical protein ELE36_08850 [Pseudolysobacter antarcticus]|uniref:Uncharacterized protein n=1 Tax=Pseudolysobacter antarcticus TaxID=2511995 RepID=A0A411HIX9_9GAMM|nr:carboxypeptidase-like regulatory domain-containing protein [Pseudolysobacter antarcticus]QBB70465.1 hypothetical protein ELE36_08850 [Pseudolysobacter antarcticus]
MGRITDSATGEPIAGATVYAIWNYHPISIPRLSIPLPIEGTHAASSLCGGSVVATTDALGYYDFDRTISMKVRLHEAHQWVIADGYYNDWQGPELEDKHDFAQLLSQLRWDPLHKQQDNWSKKLTPLGNASIDVKLLTLLTAMQSAVWCTPPTESNEANLKKFQRAGLHAINAAICEATTLEQTPRSDVYKLAFTFFMGKDPRVRLLQDPSVQPLIPRRQRSPVPQSLMETTCNLTKVKNDD